MSKHYVTTEEAAEILLVKPDTLRSSFCRNGHYQQIRPIKLLNRRLGWPIDQIQRYMRIDR